MRNATSWGAMAGVLMIAIASGVARGEVTLKAYYKLGEDGDTPAATSPATALYASIGTNARKDFAFSNSLLSIITGTTGALGSTKYLNTQAAGWTPWDGASSSIGGATLAEYGTTNWGMSAWLKMPTLAAANAKTRTSNFIMSSGNTSNMLAMNRASTDTYWWSLGATNATTVRVDNSLFDTWVHTAFVYNGSNVMQLYVNGALAGTKAQNATYASSGTRQQQLWIGTAANNTSDSGGNQWMGGMDELKVFTFAAGQFAISDVYNPVPEPGPVVVLCAGLAGMIPLSRMRCR